MVANIRSLNARFAPAPEWSGERRRRLVARFTRNDVAALVRLGIIPEDASTELLNGQVVLKDRAAQGADAMTIGKNHSETVERLSDLRTSINTPQRHVRSQQPLVCGETHEPEPDFMVLRGTLSGYVDLPAAADAWCVVEVADGSYELDAGEKLAGYARAGVEQYIIINLRNRSAEIYTTAQVDLETYQSRQIIDENSDLTLRIGNGEYFSVPLKSILP